MMRQTAGLISVATYNVLCDAYIKPERYPNCRPEDLVPGRRHPALVERVAGLATDIICLQEVTFDLFVKMQERLEAYEGRWTRRTPKPDGCATFVRKAFQLTGYSSYAFDDRASRANAAPSGHIFTVARLERDGRKMRVVNTHLKYDLPDAAEDDRYGFRQAKFLRNGLADSDGHLVLCGDLNGEPDSQNVRLLTRGVLSDAHPASCNTCCANGRAHKIDYVLYGKLMRAVVGIVPRGLTDTTALPTEEEPSDHLPLTAFLTFGP